MELRIKMMSNSAVLVVVLLCSCAALVEGYNCSGLTMYSGTSCLGSWISFDNDVCYVASTSITHPGATDKGNSTKVVMNSSGSYDWLTFTDKSCANQVFRYNGMTCTKCINFNSFSWRIWIDSVEYHSWSGQ